MKKSSGANQPAGISSEAVAAKTGKGWPEWCRILDAAGAKKMTHREIAALLRTRHGIGSWWQQMITVGYEQSRGLREKYQKGKVYSITVSRTVAAPVSALYKAWADEKVRRRWLDRKGLVVRGPASHKTVRVRWPEGATNLLVAFYPRGKGKGQVAVSHEKLADAKAAARMKRYWAGKLDRLVALAGK
jgi:Domain of unknown function (DUF4287)